MEYVEIVRKPFFVEAIQVTTENIEEIATLVGRLEHRDGKPYIHVNPNVVPGVRQVFPGYWMTRMGDQLRCYNKRVFAKQFCEKTPEIEAWVNFINNTNEVSVGEFGRIVEPEVPSEELPQPAVQEGAATEPTRTEIEVVVNDGTPKL